MPYMPPEVLLGQPTDERSDIWSFGVMLFEMATGELPFRGRNEFELTAAILRSPPQPLPAHVPPDDPQRHPALPVEGSGASLSARRRSPCRARGDPVGRRDRPGRRRHRAAPVRAAALDCARRSPRSRSPIAAVVWWLQTSREPASWERAASGGQADARRRRRIRRSSTRRYRRTARCSAYAAEDADGQIDLFVRRVAGGALVKLTNDAARESVAAVLAGR